MLKTLQPIKDTMLGEQELKSSSEKLGSQDSVRFPKEVNKQIAKGKPTDMTFSKKMRDITESEVYDTMMDQRNRQKLQLDDDEGISVSQNTSKLPSIVPDRKSGMSHITGLNNGMSVTGNHFGKKFIDLDEQLNAPADDMLKYHEFELVPKMRETYNYGSRPNPNFSTLYNPQVLMNNYQTDVQSNMQEDVDDVYASNENLMSNQVDQEQRNEEMNQSIQRLQVPHTY